MNNPQPSEGRLPPPPTAPSRNNPPQFDKQQQPNTKSGMGFGQFFARTITVASVTITAITILVALSLLAFVGALGAFFATSEPEGPFRDAVSVGGTPGAEDIILIVPVEGVILSSGGGGFSFATGGVEMRETLERAASEPRVKAVVLEMSTPGGTIPGSIDIAEGVKAVQAAGKPVVAYVRDLSASGGMWAMAPADTIVAHPGSVVGSIGVIFGPLRFYDTPVSITDFFSGVETLGGVNEFYVTGGRGKDIGNPFRELTEGERADLQQFVDGAYDDFVAHVATSRDITERQIRDDLGAMVFRAEDAVSSGLVDSVGFRDDAIEEAVSAAGVDEYDIQSITFSSGLFSGLFGETAEQVEEYMEARTRAGIGTLCGSTASAYAYHGDLSAYCMSNR